MPLILSVYAAVAGAITTPILALTVLWRGSRYALPPPMLPAGMMQQQQQLQQPLTGDGAVLGAASSSALVPVTGGTAPVGAAAAVPAAPQSVIPVVTAK